MTDPKSSPRPVDGSAVSRRTVVKLAGATVVTLAVSPSVAEAAAGRPRPLTRAEFAAMISDHFDWVHSSEYLDPFKNPQPTFTDVTVGRTRFAKQIEAALEEGVLTGAGGRFRPAQDVTWTDAAEWLVRAFLRPSGVVGAQVAGEEPAVASLLPVGEGDRVRPRPDTLTQAEADAVFAQIQALLVSPPQVMCKPGTTAPRRYITISTPTPGATIHYEFTYDGSEPPSPTTASPTFDLRQNGVLQFVNPLNSGVDGRHYRLKAVAVKSGLATSPVRHFEWHILRPAIGEFRSAKIKEATATSPAIWKIDNPAEYYQANVYYIEGSIRGVVFDAGEYGYQRANLKTYIDSFASRPYDLVLGHAHPDHSEQVYNFTSAGVAFYATEIERAALLASPREDFRAAGQACIPASYGQQLDLGNVQVSLFHAPGHTHGLLTLLINQTGWVYASDHFGCNRAYTADTTQYSQIKADLFLSLQHQLLADYRARCGTITEVTNAHQVTPVGMECVDNFVGCFQQLIDQGDAVTEPSIRGGVVGNPTGPVRNSRMSKIGDMWRDKNWMAIGNPLGTGLNAPVDYLSAPTTAYPSGVGIDYNQPDGYTRYSVLGNVGFEGGTLIGVDVYWAAPANGVENNIGNRFDPWTYEYTVRVARGTRRLVVTPNALSNNVRWIRVNGTIVRQRESHRVRVRPGNVVSIEVLAPDGVTRSLYRFTVAQEEGE